MPVRRLRKKSEALEVSAFINLIVVLVPFLLSTAVFSRMSVVDLTLPAKSANYEGLKDNDLKLCRGAPRCHRGRGQARRSVLDDSEHPRWP